MNILIHIHRSRSPVLVKSGRAVVRIYSTAPAVLATKLPEAVKRVAMKRRGTMGRTPPASYWPDDMKLLQISETCWRCEWPGEEHQP
jgi:hypothetical protein